MPNIGPAAGMTFMDGGVKTSSFTALVGYAYECNNGAQFADIVVTLPTSPSPGACVLVTRSDNTANIQPYTVKVRGTFLGVSPGSDWTLGIYSSILFVYQNGTWIGFAYGSSSFLSGFSGPNWALDTFSTPTLMARDINGNVEVALPSSTNHATTKGYVDGRTLTVALQTSAFTATPGSYNRCVPASNFNCTLPTAPPDGTVVEVYNAATNPTLSVSIVRGGTDTHDIGAGTASIALFAQESMRLVYRAANTKWYTVSSLWSQAIQNTGTIVRRDPSGRAQFVDPAAAQDAATKNYVDNNVGLVLSPPASRVANLAYTTAEVITIQWAIPASTLKAGSVLRLAATGVFTAGTTPTITARIRAGTAGTTSDTSILSGTSASVASTGNWRIEATVTCRTTGATGTILGEIGIFGDAIVPKSIVNGGTATVDTTGQLFLSLCFTATGTSSAGNVMIGYGEVVHP